MNVATSVFKDCTNTQKKMNIMKELGKIKINMNFDIFGSYIGRLIQKFEKVHGSWMDWTCQYYSTYIHTHTQATNTHREKHAYTCMTYLVVEAIVTTLVQTFTSRACHDTSTESNHPYFPSIPNVKRKFY